MKPKPDVLANRFPCLTIVDVEKVLRKLDTFNAQGAGIFVAVNEFDGQRAKANLSRVRGVHADFDDVDVVMLEKVRAILRPTIEVQTSGPRHWHFYWLLNDGEKMMPSMAEDINRGLVQLGADPAAIDIARLLRLPGFKHMKNQRGACDAG
jgi:hypothetical protein